MEDDADGGAERGARRHTGDVRVGQRVQEEVLEDHAGHGQRRADERGDQDARHADLPEDRVVEVTLGRPRQQQVPDATYGQRGRPQGERQHEAHQQDAGCQEDPRQDACAGEPGHWAVSASGWM